MRLRLPQGTHCSCVLKTAAIARLKSKKAKIKVELLPMLDQTRFGRCGVF